MAPKSLVLAALLLAVVAAVGQVPRGAEAGTNAAAAASPSTSVLISGIVPCAAGTSINVATVPVFPNAGVQLVCGGGVVAGATADGTGAFHISLGSVGTDLLTALLGNQCKVVVITPLAACNAALAGATGTLTAPLKLLGATTAGSSGSDNPLSGIIGVIIGLVGQIIGGILNLATEPFSLV
ncbi:hypothetical protein ACP70R_012407 [Stipagrostis hirtigluma subsp. patula]